MQLRQWIVAAAFLLPCSPAVLAQSATPATTQTSRTMAEVARDIQNCSKELSAITSSPRDLLDPARRAELGPKALPILNRFEGLMQEFAQLHPERKQEIEIRRYQLLAMKALLGDNNAEASLKQAAESKDEKIATAGKSALLTVDWVRTDQDPAGQSKVLDRTAELAKANPTDPNVAMLLVQYVQFGSASAENHGRAIKIINEDLKGPVADQIRAQLAAKAAAAATQPSK